MPDFGRINNELHVDKEEECELVSKPVRVHLVDGHFMIEPVPDPLSIIHLLDLLNFSQV